MAATPTTCSRRSDTGTVTRWGKRCVPLIDNVDATKAAIDTYLDEYAQAIYAVFHAKLGLATTQPADDALIGDLMVLLDANRTDWTRFWRRLASLRSDADSPADDAAVRDLIVDRLAFDAWACGIAHACELKQRRHRARAQDEPRQSEVRVTQPPGRSRHPPGARGRRTTRLRENWCACSTCSNIRTTNSRDTRHMPPSRRTGRSRCTCSCSS